MIGKAIAWIEETKFTITGWIFSFISILFIRFLLESLSSPSSSGIIPSDPYTLIHYALFFFSLALGSSIILGFFGKDYESAPKIILFGLPLLWAAPLIDIILSHGRGFKMLYIFDTGKNLIFDLLTFFGPSLKYGATYGMRAVIATSIFGLSYYIYIKTEDYRKAILFGISLYVLIFIIGSFPGVLYSIANVSNLQSNSETVVRYFGELIIHSTIFHNTIHDGAFSTTANRFIELGFDKLMSQILFIFSAIFALILAWKVDERKFKAVISNCRRERLTFYTFSLIGGMAFAYLNNLGNKIVWIDWFGIISLLIAWACLWMHAVHINDIADLEIDKISNKKRPLVRNELSLEEMRQIGSLWLSFGLLGAWVAGFYPFFMALAYVAASYIYSSPPLRLRSLPLVPSFLISIACLSTILAGFFFVSVNKSIDTFPIFLAIGIIIMVTLAINFKDIKDVEGDSANNILTLPTMFGKHGERVVGLCFALSILLLPFFLSFYWLYIIAIPSALIGYMIVVKKPYDEKPIFTLRFVFLFGIGVFYLVAYFLGHTF